MVRYLYRGSKPEERHLELLLFLVEVHDIDHVGLELVQRLRVLHVDLLGQDVHVLVVGAADRHGLGEYLEVAHGLNELEHVVAALHEDVQVEKAVVVALGPRAVLPHHFVLVVLGHDLLVVRKVLNAPKQFLVEIDPSVQTSLSNLRSPASMISRASLLVEFMELVVESVRLLFEVQVRASEHGANPE